MRPMFMAQVVSELILFLVSPGWKVSDRRRELIVPVSPKARHRRRGGTEWKRQCESQIGVARLCKVKAARIEEDSSQQRRGKRVLIRDQKAKIVIVRQQPRRGKRALLDQIVVGCVFVRGTAQVPLRLG